MNLGTETLLRSEISGQQDRLERCGEEIARLRDDLEQSRRRCRELEAELRFRQDDPWGLVLRDLQTMRAHVQGTIDMLERLPKAAPAKASS
jgi:chromosome segregation ATPase